MDIKIVNNIKTLAVEMINKAGSGHTGIALSAAPILYTLYSRHINIEPNQPNWINRDRFVMSAGHGSALLYATLYFAGYNISLEDLKQFRQIDSKTPGHPEFGITSGVDATTGPLGQGLGTAVGMALASKILGDKYTLSNGIKDNTSLINYKVYVLCSDGDLMEGVSYEAASLAGTLNLDNLIVLYDSNKVSLDGDTSNTFTENVIDRFKAMGWYTDQVRNGSDINEIDEAIDEAKMSGRPSFIEIKTIIGKGTKYEGTSKAHGLSLNDEEVLEIKRRLDIPLEPFYVNEEAVSFFRSTVKSRSNYKEWSLNLQRYLEFNKLEKLDFSSEINLLDLKMESDKNTTRDLNHIVMQEIGKRLDNFIGGSADLRSSTRAYFDNFDDIKDSHYKGKNIWFGVREHVMGAVLNGLALSNIRCFGSTFLAFSDYLKPAIRMSAIMNLPVTYIFSHDSVSIGEDGPTHQPIEQLSSLRMIPNLDVFRPADLNELIGCWNVILNKQNPSALVISKEVIKEVPTDTRMTMKGAYIIKKEEDRLDGIIIATGSEVHKAYFIAKKLYEEKRLSIRVISMPSVSLYKKQNIEYKNELFPVGKKVIVIEAGASGAWYEFVYNKNYLLTLDEFGASGKSEDVLKKFNFDYESLKNRVERLLK